MTCMPIEERIQQRFVARAIRLARYRRALVAVGLGLAAFGWMAWADRGLAEARCVWRFIGGAWRCL
jgi:hypothetical protein